METIQRFGHTWDITPLQAIRTRFSAIGDVSRLTGPDLNEDETVDVRFTMVDGWIGHCQAASDGRSKEGNKIDQRRIEGTRGQCDAFALERTIESRSR